MLLQLQMEVPNLHGGVFYSAPHKCTRTFVRSLCASVAGCPRKHCRASCIVNLDRWCDVMRCVAAIVAVNNGRMSQSVLLSCYMHICFLGSILSPMAIFRKAIPCPFGWGTPAVDLHFRELSSGRNCSSAREQTRTVIATRFLLSRIGSLPSLLIGNCPARL